MRNARAGRRRSAPRALIAARCGRARLGAAALVGLRGRRGASARRCACRSTARARCPGACGCGWRATRRRAGGRRCCTSPAARAARGWRSSPTCCSSSAGCRSASSSSPSTSAAPARSGLLRCPALERDTRLRSTRGRRGRARRSSARGARFYTTRDSVEDIEAVRRALRRGEADAVRHLLRHEARARLRARPPGARRADRARLGARPRRRRPRSAASRTAAMAADAEGAVPGALPRRERRPGGRPRAARRPAARARRCAGVVYRPRGRRRRATLTALALSDLMFDSDYNPAIRAGIPAAVRAALDHGDAAPLLRLVARPPRALARCRARATFSAARYAAVCEETPLPWPRGTPFGERGKALAQARRTALGPGAFFPFGYAEARADEIDLCLRWADASPAAACRRRLPGGAGADPPGRGGPADAAGRLGAGGGARCRARSAWSCRASGTRWWAATRRAAACGGCWRSCAGGRPRRRARGWRRRCRPRRCPDGAGPGRARARHAGRARAARWRRSTSRSTTSRSRSRRPSARRWRAPGLRGGSFRLRRRRIVLGGLQVVPGVRVSGVLPRRGSARLRISGAHAAARPGAGLADAAWCAGGSGGGGCAGGCGRGRRGRWRAVRGERRGEDGTIPAQDGVVFRPAPHLASSLPLRMRSTPR